MVTPSARRAAAQHLIMEKAMAVSRACRIVGLSRAAFYKEPQAPLTRDANVIDALNDIVEKNPRSFASARCVVESQAGLARVLPAGAEHPEANEKAAA